MFIDIYGKNKSNQNKMIRDYIDNPRRQYSANHGLSPMEKEHRFRGNTL